MVNIFNNLKAVFLVFGKIKNWQLYISDFLGLIKNRNITYKLRNGIKCRVRANTCDRGIINEIFLFEDYLLKKEDIRKGDCVIDLGAQAGIFSLFGASKKAKVYSFEPFLPNYEMLLKNIEINNFQDRIIPFNLAVSDSDKKLKFNICDDNTGGHSCIRENSGKSVEVNAISLKTLFKKNNISRCNLLKCDVEGSEYPIFYNAPKDILQRIDRIYMEFHDFSEIPNYNHRSLKQFFEKNNFTVLVKAPYLYAVRK